MASSDAHGLKVRLPNGNKASRTLAIRIHELDARDKKLLEAELQGPLRAIDFTLQSAGVNRPLRPKDDESTKSASQQVYRDQINKAANAIQDIITGLQGIDGQVNAEVSEAIESTSDPDLSGQPKSRPLQKSNFRIPKFIKAAGSHIPLIIATLAFITVAIFHFSEPATDESTYRSTLPPPDKVEYSRAFGGSLSLSPDGRQLAFVTIDSTGQSQLWVRSLDALTGRQLNGTEGASLPFWSPDSRFLGFFANGELRKIEVSGGPPQTICDAPSGRGGTWNDQGTIVFCPSSGPFPLSRVPSSGGSPIAITKLDSTLNHRSHRWPTFLPDGLHFLYQARTAASAEDDAIYLGSLDTTFVPRLLVQVASSVE